MTAARIVVGTVIFRSEEVNRVSGGRPRRIGE
jgi:hypothetical protein